MPQSLTNIVLSINTCPSCKEVNGVSKTLAEWQASRWGVPGSGGRFCESSCHCILVPDGRLQELPAIGFRIKLRGDKPTDIRPVIEIGPREKGFGALIEEWNETRGVLPQSVYTMSVDEAVIFLRGELRG